ncbi:MAG: hypothetical protein K0S86_5230 [Geminicoccaceae bacterium]|nr:hypothetical protein [Geminicoccaceae bacterium]
MTGVSLEGLCRLASPGCCLASAAPRRRFSREPAHCHFSHLIVTRPEPPHPRVTHARLDQRPTSERDMNGIVAFLRKLGVNRAVFYSLLTRGAQSANALVTIGFVGRFLTPVGQGYYYTILSFVAFVLLGEFGLNYAVMQSASHESAALTGGENAAAVNTRTRHRLRLLLSGADRVNACTTTLAVLIVAGIGTHLLGAARGVDVADETAWAGPWTLAILAVAANQLLAPRVALLEGVGEVTAVWQFRLRQEFLIAAVLWGALASGLGLWSVGLAYATRFVNVSFWLRSHRAARLVRELGRPSAEDRPRSTYWRTEVWPFQWRIGLSGLAGYMIFQLFTPIMFALHGARVAGQFGMTLTITNGLLIAMTAWLNSQAPLYGRLIAQRAYDELNSQFARAVRSSFAVVAAVSLVLVSLVALLESRAHPMSERVLPTVPFALLTASTVLNHLIFALAVYLRAHRKEPLLIISLCGAIATPLTLYVTARFATVTWVAGSYLALTLLGGLVTLSIFVSRSRAWHARELVVGSTDGA